MASLLKRLAASGAAYQASSLVAGFLALFTLPLYTRHLTRAQLGYAETLLTAIILVSILLRFGIGEAFVRFWFDDDDAGRRDPPRAAPRRRSSSCDVDRGGLVAVVLAGPLSRLLLGIRDATLVAFGVLGLWAFTNLEIAYALLRVEERRRVYLIASVDQRPAHRGADRHARRRLRRAARAATCSATTPPRRSCSSACGCSPCAATSRSCRARAAGRPQPLLAFGSPTVPADAAVFALNVIDRAYILRADSPAAAGLYAVAVKLATAVIVAVRGFQLAWPPLAYSLTDETEAGRVYAFVTTAYVGRDGARRRRLHAARALGRAPARGRRVLRGPRGAAVGRARLGALRAVPRLRDDRRPREGHDPHVPGRGRGPRRERRRRSSSSSARSASRAPGSRCAPPTS